MADDDDNDAEGVAEPSEAPATDPGDPNDLLPRGTSLGRYSILGQLEETDDAVLYAAYDVQSQRKIAIKLLRVRVTPDDPNEQQALLRLAREAQRGAKINHPCVVQVLEVGVFHDRVFMAMEFIDGIDLRNWMEARDDPFPWPEVLRVFREAGRGLAAAHDAGVVHGDFKPANVILGESGRICVLNFGLSRDAFNASKDDADIRELRSSLPEEVVSLSGRERGYDKDKDKRQSGTDSEGEGDSSPANLIDEGGENSKDGDEVPAAVGGFGTPAYMAPERHVSRKVLPPSDQFSFCVALYEALYGERPFAGTRPVSLALAAVNRNIRPAPEGATVPAWLRAAVLKGLSPLPEDRHTSMEALLRELASDPKASRKRWVVGGAVIAAGVAGVLGVAQLREAEKAACAPETEKLNDIWGPKRREALKTAMLASKRPWAEPTWNTIEDRVDDWVAVWGRGTELACLATRAWGVADEELYTRRKACLDRGLAELAALSRALEAPSQSVVQHAHGVAMGLRPPRRCRDDDSLLRRPMAPADLAERIALLRADVEDVRAYLRAGQTEAALHQAAELELEIASIGHTPLHVEVVLLRGEALARSQKLQEARTFLERGAALAHEAGLEPELADAYIQLSGVLRGTGHADEAERLTMFAAGLVRRLNLSNLGPPLAVEQAEIAIALGKPSVALSKYYRAIKLESDRLDAHPLRLGPMWIRLGQLLIAQGDPETAVTHFADARRIFEQVLGPQHPLVADALLDLARAQGQLGNDAAAIASLQRALEVRRQLDGATLGAIELRLADALLRTGDAAQAITRFSEAEASYGALNDPRRLYEAAYGRGLAEVADGADAPAAVSLARAVEHANTVDDPILRADARFALAQVLWNDATQQTRALALAGLAERAYFAEGDAHAASRQSVNDWAAARAEAQRRRAENKPEPTPAAPPTKAPADDAETPPSPAAPQDAP